MVRCIMESLAIADRRALRDAQRLSDRAVRTVHLVGGGARNPLPCQLTADACDLPVIAGPVEAAASGHALAQARAMGVQGELGDLRAPGTGTPPSVGCSRADARPDAGAACPLPPWSPRSGSGAVMLTSGRTGQHVAEGGAMRERIGRGPRWTAGLIVLAALLAACGSGSNSGGSTTSAAAITSAPASSSPTAASGTSIGSSAPAATTAASSGGGSAAGAAYCTEKGGEVQSRTASWGTNGDPSTWLALAGQTDMCRFQADDEAKSRHLRRPGHAQFDRADTGRPGLSLEGAVDGDPQ